MTLDFPYPIYIDTYKEFSKINNIPQDNRFHNFLIDNDGNVKFVGDPTSDKKLMSVFFDALSNIN